MHNKHMQSQAHDIPLSYKGVMSPKYELFTSKKSPQYKANRPPPSPMRSLCSLKDVPLHLAPMGLAKIDGNGPEKGDESGI
jgi:hypothetical protein